MQLPEKCPICGSKLEYLSDLHLCPDTNPQEAGLEGNCYKCGSIVYSKFKLFEAELTTFDKDGNEIETKKL